jgi:yqey domain-containing protein
MTLLEKINNDMITYMKSKDSFSLGVIRMVKGAIQLEKINKKRDLTDDEVISVISKQIKMRNDSINEFAKANREDLIEQNKKEIALLSTYMPAQLSELEINKIIDDAFNTVNPTSSKDMGLIMKEVSPKLKGKADMGKVNNIIKERLANL